ncbi:MAG: CDP-alcohol phosphatidyltransferase family protein [Candidatus Binataceae bacterium]
MADDLHGAPGRHKGQILEHSAQPREPRSRLLAQTPNALTISRFAFAAAWVAFALTTPGDRRVFAIFAVIAAATDFIDGRIARRLGVARESGGWLDSIADVTFVLAALGCYAHAREVPLYIPVLIAFSFAQYAFDSRWMYRAGRPVRSRLGHWGGIINYALVLTLAFTKSGSAARTYLDGMIPVIGLFYIAAIIERAVAYRTRHGAAELR